MKRRNAAIVLYASRRNKKSMANRAALATKTKKPSGPVFDYLSPALSRLRLPHHPANMQSPLDVDFGVQVTRSFPNEGEVFAIETPAGKVATQSTPGGRAPPDAIVGEVSVCLALFKGILRAIPEPARFP
jgi:hypothetical protein